MKISEYLLQTLECNGVTRIFGNSGTTEIPLVRACEQRKNLKCIVALSEVAAVPVADGYARATRTLGVVNLHVAPGLGNGMGNLYTVGIAGTPLLVLVGAQDRRFLHTNPILSGPLEQMAASVCKAVFGLNTRFDAVANIRQALRAALTPPYAPVALICPSDPQFISPVTKPTFATCSRDCVGGWMNIQSLVPITRSGLDCHACHRRLRPAGSTLGVRLTAQRRQPPSPTRTHAALSHRADASCHLAGTSG